MREIVLDTETTGLDPASGHRLVEIACLELVNHLPSGRLFHHYLNPDRDMPEDAFAVHGLSAVFLADKPRFQGGRRICSPSSTARRWSSTTPSSTCASSMPS